MELEKQLRRYEENGKFREALGIPGEEKIEFTLLAQGEYNVNYAFTHPVTGQKLLLRVNTGSQMHLEHQIEYEYNALKDLEASGRTPKVFYVDGSRELFPYGVLVMEYLPGLTMDYHTDLMKGAAVLADIHSIPIPKDTKLIRSLNPCREILEECDQMFRVYEESELGDPEKKKWIRAMLDVCVEKTRQMENYRGYRCCINTELNSTNFLINGDENQDFLIDWEKPLYGDPAQDLGHFLAPTTTFWKSDVILTPEQMDEFLNEYIFQVKGRFEVGNLKERVGIFVPVTCLRGVTWCAMAWVEYQEPSRALRNESTWLKLGQYLDNSFLKMIERQVAMIKI